MDLAVGATERHEPIIATPPAAEMRNAAAYILQLRKAAKPYLGREAQSEPAWKLMLALYSTSGSPGGCRVGSAIKQADLPLTTGLRWVSKLHRCGFIHARSDPTDKRASRVELTSSGIDAVQRAFVAARYISK